MLKFLKKLLILLILTAPALGLAQQWAVRYSNPTHNDLLTDDKSFSITVSNTDFVYVTGFSFSDSTNYDFCTIKYSSSGDTIWTALFNGGGASEDKAYAIVVDDQDNVYVTGYSTTGTTGTDITTVKYNASGTEQWHKSFNGSGNGNDGSTAICRDNLGNIYVTGYVTSAAGGKDMVIIKYNSDGNQLWFYTYNGYANSDDIAYAMAIDSQNNVVITGSSRRGSGEGTEDMMTIKVDGSGFRLWAKSYGTWGGEDKAYAIEVDDLDKIIITGYTTWSSTKKDITTIKYLPNGYTQWIRTYDGEGFDDIAHTIALTSIGDVIVAGTSQSGPDESTKDYIIIKYDGISGTRLWVNTFDGIADNTDIANSIAVSDIDNAVYITGSSKSGTEPGTEDMVTLKFDITSGAALDSMVYDGYGEDVAYDIAVDTTGNVYITGYTAPGGGNDVSNAADYLTVKYSKGEFNKIKFTPGSFALIQNYPNPFNPSTTIKFQLPSPGAAKLAVYDILGRQVDLLLDQFMKSGNYAVVFNGNKLSSGVYFAELTFGNLKDVKRMVLVK